MKVNPQSNRVHNSGFIPVRKFFYFNPNFFMVRLSFQLFLVTPLDSLISFGIN